MKIYTSIILVIIGLNLSAQIDFGYSPENIPKETAEIIKIFEKAKQVEGSNLYYGGVPSEVFRHFEKLLAVATKEELIELTKHPNAITRYYAYSGLLEKQPQLETLLNITKLHLKDTVVVDKQSGCIGSSITIGDFMLSSINLSDEFELSDKQKLEIDSLLFWNEKNQIDERNSVFYRMEKSVYFSNL